MKIFGFISNHYRMLVKVVISCTLIMVALHGVDISSIFLQIMLADTLNIVFSLILILGVSLLHSKRWEIILCQLKIKLPYAETIKLVLISYFFNQTLPSTVGGDAFRIWGAQSQGVSLRDSVSSVAIDRIIALISILIMILASSPLLFDLFGAPFGGWAIVLLLAAGTTCLTFLLLNRLENWFGRWRLVRGVIYIMVCARTVFSDMKAVSSVILLSICSYLVVSFAVYLLACAMSINLEFKYSLLLMPLVILVTVLPISIAGWGIREGAMVVSLGMVGVNSVDALSLSILLGLLGIASGLPGGLLWLLQSYRKHNLIDN